MFKSITNFFDRWATCVAASRVAAYDMERAKKMMQELA